jgi:uncharacterized protein with FMN-binding domain
MRRAILALTSTIAGLVLLLSFKTHVPGATQTATASGGSTGSAGSAGAGSAGPGSADMAGGAHAGHRNRRRAGARSSGHGATRATHATHATRMVTGAVASTTYGPMQVRVTLTGQSITKVTVLQRTNDGAESDQIDANAIPKLVGETLAVQSARINAVSGASYTSAGYRKSLQSALDKAGA